MPNAKYIIKFHDDSGELNMFKECTSHSLRQILYCVVYPCNHLFLLMVMWSSVATGTSPNLPQWVSVPLAPPPCKFINTSFYGMVF